MLRVHLQSEQLTMVINNSNLITLFLDCWYTNSCSIGKAFGSNSANWCTKLLLFYGMRNEFIGCNVWENTKGYCCWQMTSKSLWIYV